MLECKYYQVAILSFQYCFSPGLAVHEMNVYLITLYPSWEQKIFTERQSSRKYVTIFSYHVLFSEFMYYNKDSTFKIS